MPRGDRTGPDGFGPMTGRGAGYCAGFSVPGFRNYFGGRRNVYAGQGRGRRNRYISDEIFDRRLFRNRFNDDGLYAQEISAEEELNLYRNQAAAMESNLSALKNRIIELEAETDKNSSK